MATSNGGPFKRDFVARDLTKISLEFIEQERNCSHEIISDTRAQPCALPMRQRSNFGSTRTECHWPSEHLPDDWLLTRCSNTVQPDNPSEYIDALQRL
mmetsp:Transcript_8635/g.16723  ORF Transcript_8635/g.16723 Transcript_8635/m.16723 type:complete len:98 (-) Transcript_8635:51-344(-)